MDWFFSWMFWFGVDLRDILHPWEIPSCPPSSYLTRNQFLSLTGLIQDIATDCSLSEKRFLPWELYMCISRRMLGERWSMKEAVCSFTNVSAAVLSSWLLGFSRKLKGRRITSSHQAGSGVKQRSYKYTGALLIGNSTSSAARCFHSWIITNGRFAPHISTPRENARRSHHWVIITHCHLAFLIRSASTLPKR